MSYEGNGLSSSWVDTHATTSVRISTADDPGARFPGFWVRIQGRLFFFAARTKKIFSIFTLATFKCIDNCLYVVLLDGGVFGWVSSILAKRSPDVIFSAP